MSRTPERNTVLMSYSMDVKRNSLHLRAPQRKTRASGCIYSSGMNHTEVTSLISQTGRNQASFILTDRCPLRTREQKCMVTLRNRLSSSKSQTWQCDVTLHAWALSCFSRFWLLATLWTVAHQAPRSMGFSRQEYWVGCHAIFLRQESNPCLVLYRWVLYQWAPGEACYVILQYAVLKLCKSDWDLNPCSWDSSGVKTQGLLTEITHLVSGLNEAQVLDVSSQK